MKKKLIVFLLLLTSCSLWNNQIETSNIENSHSDFWSKYVKWNPNTNLIENDLKCKKYKSYITEMLNEYNYNLTYEEWLNSKFYNKDTQTWSFEVDKIYGIYYSPFQKSCIYIMEKTDYLITEDISKNYSYTWYRLFHINDHVYNNRPKEICYKYPIYIESIKQDFWESFDSYFEDLWCSKFNDTLSKKYWLDLIIK